MNPRNELSNISSDFYGVDVKLPKRRDKKTKFFYDRTIQYPPGMKELTDIVAKLQKDVKRFNQCVTLAGAEQYAANKGDNWSAFAADVTGPGGEKDGIDEIFVADGYGNIRVVNGVGLAKSDYPMRKAYRTMFPTKAERKENPYRTYIDEEGLHEGFRNHYNVITEGRDAETNQWGYVNDIGELGAEFKQLKQKITPKDVFKQHVFKPVYDGQKQAFIEGRLNGIYLAQTFNIGLSKSYEKFVLEEVAQRLGKTKEQMKLPVNKKLINKAQDVQMDVVNDIIDNDLDNIQAGIDNEILGQVATEMLDKQDAAEQQPEEAPPSPVKAYATTSPGRKIYKPAKLYTSPQKK